MATERFYGWIVVAAAFLALASAYSLHFSFGVFAPGIAAEVGLGKAAASAPFSVYIAVYSVLSFITGPLTDRLGPRPVVLIGGVLLAVAYVLLSQATTLSEIYLSLGLLGGFGMSATFIPLNATVVKWFVRQRGLALAIAGTGGTAAVMVGPPLAAALIALIGWRGGMLALGVGCGLMVVLSSMLLVRDPEAMGLSPDGDAPQHAGEPTSPMADEGAWNLSEARKTGAFWLILSAFFLAWAGLFFPVAHIPFMLADRGMDSITAASLFTAMGLGTLFGRWVTGWLWDRIGRQSSLVACFGALSLGFVLVGLPASLGILYAGACLFGLGMGSSVTIFPAFLAAVFGRAHVGAIAGFIFSISGTAAALGPYGGGMIRESTGSYVSAFATFAIMSALALVLTLLVQTPKKPTSDARA